MAMTKSEMAILEDLRRRASLTLPPYEKPKMADPRAELSGRAPGSLFVGWTMNSHVCRVSQGCSNGTNHSRDNPAKTSSQGPGQFYQTELEAYRAMRWELTERVMRELGDVDAKIAALAVETREVKP